MSCKPTETPVSLPAVSSRPSLLFSIVSGRGKQSKCLGGSAHRAGLGGHIPGFPSLPVLWTASPLLHSAKFSCPGVHSSLHVPSGVSFLPACFEITSRGCCTRGPRRQVKGEEEGAGLPTLKLRRNTEMPGCSGVEECVQGCQTSSLAAGPGAGGALGPPHLAGHLTLPIGIFMALVP